MIALPTATLTGPALQRALEEKAPDINDPKRNPYLDPRNNEWAADWHRVVDIKPLGGGRYDARFQETPNQARRRMMDAPAGSNEAISFHSAIPANAMHSRRAVAYDLAIGQACSIDDEVFYAYLCRVADWRLSWSKEHGSDRNDSESDSNDVTLPDIRLIALYEAELKENRELIDATDLYHSNLKPKYDAASRMSASGGGFLPSLTINAPVPTLVVNETIRDRDHHFYQRGNYR